MKPAELREGRTFIQAHRRRIEDKWNEFFGAWDQGRTPRDRLYFTRGALHVVLAGGREVSVLLEWLPRLRGATARQRKKWRPIGGGGGIHWPDIDEDVSVESLLALT